MTPLVHSGTTLHDTSSGMEQHVAQLGVNCIARRLIRPNALPPLDSPLSTRTGVVVVGDVVGEHQVWEMQMSEEEQELLHLPRAWTEQLSGSAHSCDRRGAAPSDRLSAKEGADGLRTTATAVPLAHNVNFRK
ncbi:hypothetical protein BLNAU_22187 [Blattamonas nauphoetae]|uniref:Uncharacterized protein n=1 Tax=Blattamonas nauphoetae TaxID=2049346 RepID=A0ABQ9WTQ3_9EUKA|nr:hypothetical protein BLNAU_22187 [Blattamonas nauphoetae]